MQKDSTLYQYGTLALLVPGLFEGTKSIDDILKHGDTGIGTGDGLDGELIVLNGHPYQVDGSGKVNKLDSNFMVPFADVHFANFKPLFELESDITPTSLEKKQYYRRLIMIIYSSLLDCTVTLKKIATRSVDKQSKPYPKLVECADKQNEFSAEDKCGTLIGYYSPKLFNGPSVGGFHLHFLADDLSIGGHLLDFEVDNGTVEIQPFNKLEQDFPTGSQEFMKHDFSKDNIEAAISKSE